ncbi:MAG: hypothetical protein HY791_16205 [Deltaproteobacteria bacterium]|nr:hypothetical protein [Deltaproteobacteria bacterium]
MRSGESFVEPDEGSTAMTFAWTCSARGFGGNGDRPARRRRFSYALVCSMVACGPGTVWAPAPSAEGAKSVVLWIDETPEPRLEARDLTSDWTLRTEASAVVALLHTQPLAALELSEGPVLAEPERPCSLLRPLAALALRVGDDSAGWSAMDVEEVSPPAFDHLVPDRAERCIECGSFEITSVGPLSDEPSTNASMGAVLDSGAIVIGREGAPGLSRVTRSAVEPIEGCGERVYRDAVPIGSNRFWFVAESLVLDRVVIDESTARCQVEDSLTVSSSVSTLLASLAVSSPGEPFELFVVTSSGAAYRTEDRTFEPILNVPLSETDALAVEQGFGLGIHPEVVRLGPGRALFSAGSEWLAWWERGESRLDRTEPELDSEVTALGLDRAGSVVRGRKNGRVELFGADGWTPLFGDGPRVPVAAIATHRDGVVGIHRGGSIFQASSAAGLCPVVQYTPGGSNRNPRHLLRTRQGFAVVDGVNYLRTGVPTAVVWLDVIR